MNIQEIKEAFPDSEIRDGDLGEYIEIKLYAGVYLSVYKMDIPSDLEVGDSMINMPFVKSIEDIKILHKLFNGET